VKIVFTPDWFLSGDVFVEIFSFAILFLFFVLSIRSYKLTKNKNSFYLGLGFMLIALAELATILTKLVLYYDFYTIAIPNIGNFIVEQQIINSTDIFYFTGFFFHKLFTLIGFYLIYRLTSKEKLSGDILLVLFFITVSTLFSNTFYYLFHLIALILLFLIINNYGKIYKKNKSTNTKILIIAFSILTLSQMIFLISKVKFLYVVAQLNQLISYMILLILIIRILKLPNSHVYNP